MKYISALTALLLPIWQVSCQVQTIGLLPHSSFADVNRELKNRYRLPPMDNAHILARELVAQQHGGVKPFKFGEAVNFPISIKEDGEWTITNRGSTRTWRAVIHSPGAQSLSVLFNEFYLPQSSEFYVIGRNMTLGAFTGRLNNKVDGTFSTSPVAGDMIILEYVEPILDMFAGTKVTDQVRMEVGSVVHGFRKSPLDYRESGSCNIDVACPEGSKYRDLINSVGIFVTDHGQRFCTGAVINNPRQDGRQLFLTANHCMFQDTTRFIVGFNYQFKTCVSGGASLPSEPSMQTVQGMKLLSTWDKSDFALLEILETIPDSYNVFYAGWSRANTAPENVVGIHHPSGDVKKISLYSGKCSSSSWTELPNKYHWMVPSWSKGVTEPGSSGSPLFDNRGRVVGHLHGGQSSCDLPKGYDLYGGLSFDWDSAPTDANRVKQFLDPDNKRVVGMGGSYYALTSKGPVKTSPYYFIEVEQEVEDELEHVIGDAVDIAEAVGLREAAAHPKLIHAY